MRKYTLRETNDAIAEDEKVFIGIDVHKESLAVTVLGTDVEAPPLLRRTVPHGRKHIAGLVRRFPGCEIIAAYEAGPTGYKLVHWFEELGCVAFMTPPSKVLVDKGGKQIKYDGGDSLDIAEQLRAGLLNEVHDLGEEGYRQREVTRTREQLVRHRTQICAQIKSKLLFHGIRTPEELRANWSKRYLAWLEAGPSGDPWVDGSIHCLVEMYRALTQQIGRLEDAVETLAATEKYEADVALLRTIPGVGILTALIVLVELGDISRFNRAEEFASFLGLVPGEWSSGETQRKRSLVRWGNKRVRTALVEASWHLIGHDDAMREVYDRIKYRRGSGRAIVAVARRLALTIRAMLRDRTAYDRSH